MYVCMYVCMLTIAVTVLLSCYYRSIEHTGIAGGQRSILDKELIEAGQSHLLPLVDSAVQQVRREGGLVCQVTPAADSYAREAMRRLRGGSKTSGFTPGYAQILYGENGCTKEPVDERQRVQALNERAERCVHSLEREGKISAVTAAVLLKGPAQHHGPHAHTSSSSSCSSATAAAAATTTAAQAADEVTPLLFLRSQMDSLSLPVMLSHRAREVTARIAQLKYIDSRKELKESMERKLRRAAEMQRETAAAATATTATVAAPALTIASKISQLESELSLLRSQLSAIGISAPSAATAVEEKYHSLLLGRAADSDYISLAAGNDALKHLLASSQLPMQQLKTLLSHCGQITCSAADLLPLSLPTAAAEIEAFESSQLLGLLDTPRKKEENTTLWACFSRAAIPHMLRNFFANYYTRDITGYFPPLFKGDKSGDYDELHLYGALRRAEKKREEKSQFLYRHVHRFVERTLGAQSDSAAIVERVREADKQMRELQMRLTVWGTLEKDKDAFFRISGATVEKVKQRIQTLQQRREEDMHKLQQYVQSHLRAHPHALSTAYPQLDESGRVVFVSSYDSENDNADERQLEQKQAYEALQQIINHY